MKWNAQLILSTTAEIALFCHYVFTVVTTFAYSPEKSGQVETWLTGLVATALTTQANSNWYMTGPLSTYMQIHYQIIKKHWLLSESWSACIYIHAYTCNFVIVVTQFALEACGPWAYVTTEPIYPIVRTSAVSQLICCILIWSSLLLMLCHEYT